MRPSITCVRATPPSSAVDAALDLRDHAAADRALGDQLARLLGAELADQRARGVEHALDVGEQDQLLGAERRARSRPPPRRRSRCG